MQMCADDVSAQGCNGAVIQMISEPTAAVFEACNIQLSLEKHWKRLVVSVAFRSQLAMVGLVLQADPRDAGICSIATYTHQLSQPCTL